MFCFKCGGPMPDNSQVCPQCAARAQDAPQPTATPSFPPAPGFGGQPMQPQPYSAQPQTDGKATTSLVLGILSLLCASILAGIPAVILGHISRSSIKRSAGRLTGSGMALAGLIMGYISIAWLPLSLAIVLPNFLRAASDANQAVAASTVRTLNTAQVSYSTDYPEGYARALVVLGPGQPPVDCTNRANITAQHACLIDSVLACSTGTWCTKSGYKFNLTAAYAAGEKCEDYVITATPINPQTGGRSYCSTSDSVIRYNPGPPLRTPLSSTECQAWPALQG
jgi:type IV pilus assembly protein PilA